MLGAIYRSYFGQAPAVKLPSDFRGESEVLKKKREDAIAKMNKIGRVPLIAGGAYRRGSGTVLQPTAR